MKSGVLVLAAVLAACASSRARTGDDDDDDGVDAPAIDAPATDGDIGDPDGPVGPGIDAPMAVDAAIDAPVSVAVAALVLTEVSLAPTGGELVEILNPTAGTIDLHNYYLSDVPNYFQLPAGAQTVESNDFIVRFPPGATIAPGAVITVAMDTAANFQTTLAAAPTYSIASATMMAVQVSAPATLTNGGEPVVLFYWDGASDRVTDVDLMYAGAPSATNDLEPKSGVVVDGPDADSVGTAYATDAMTIAAQGSTAASGLSTKRLALESAATEHQTGGGNGVNGHDETSEQTGVTWDAASFTAPTPGAVPPALLP